MVWGPLGFQYLIGAPLCWKGLSRIFPWCVYIGLFLINCWILRKMRFSSLVACCHSSIVSGSVLLLRQAICSLCLSPFLNQSTDPWSDAVKPACFSTLLKVAMYRSRLSLTILSFSSSAYAVCL